MERHPDKWIIEHLQTSDTQENEVAIKYLHQRMNIQVARFILTNSGTPEDVDDIFQDSLIALYKLAKQKKLNKVANIEAYLYSICRNLWLKRLNREKRSVELTEDQENIPVPEIAVQSLLSAERQEALATLTKHLGEGCHQILLYYYYEQMTMKEIADRMQFSGEQVAKNKKSNCLKKLRKIIMDSPHFRELLKNT